MAEQLVKSSEQIPWNNNVKLIFSDVDETVAPEYESAPKGVVEGINRLLSEGAAIVFITGAGITRVQSRVTDHLEPSLRKKVLVGSCSGAEIHGFNEEGEILPPFYSILDSKMNDEQKKVWREVVDQVIEEFKLEKHPVMPTPEFKSQAGDNPLAIMYEDRGPQITFEVVNAYKLSAEQAAQMPVAIEADEEGNFDYRVPMMKRASELLEQNNIPITPRMAGEYAVDFALEGVNKTTCITEILTNDTILIHIGVSKDTIQNPSSIEIWGDKFSTKRGGTDRHIAQALPKAVRAIDFRRENPEEFEDGFNIVLWNGTKEKQDGLEEYLQSRTKNSTNL